MLCYVLERVLVEFMKLYNEVFLFLVWSVERGGVLIENFVKSLIFGFLFFLRGWVRIIFGVFFCFDIL